MANSMKLFTVVLLCYLATMATAWRTKPKTRVEENEKKPQPEVQTSGYTVSEMPTDESDEEYVKKPSPTMAYAALGGGYGQTQPSAYEKPQTQAPYNAPASTEAAYATQAAYAQTQAPYAQTQAPYAPTQAAYAPTQGAYDNGPSSPAYAPPSTESYVPTQGYANLEPLLQGQYEIKVITIRCVVKHPATTPAVLDPYAEAAATTTVAPAYGAPSTAAPAYGAAATNAAPAYGAPSTYAAPAYGQPSTVADPYGAAKTEAPAYGAPSTEQPYGPPMTTTVDPVLKSIPLCPPGTILSNE